MASSLTITDVWRTLLACVTASGLWLGISAWADGTDVTILFVDRAHDPYYATRLGYGGTYDATRQSSIAGAELAIKDSSIIGQATGKTFKLVRETLAGDATADTAIAALVAQDKASAVILDLPEADIAAVAHAGSLHDVALFNIREKSGALRQATCNTSLFHVVPSETMLQDALVQYIKSMGWQNILMLSSDAPEDVTLAAAFSASAQKFGVTIVEHRKFVAGNDPRQRDENNTRLLTGGDNYDLIYIADGKKDFSQRLAYRTYSARPVIGSSGLVPVAWHPLWERNGAPQLNRRFLRRAKRQMTEDDWAAWVAVRAVVDVASKSADGEKHLTDGLADQSLTLEVYKGYPGSFRSWDHQLRQAILLATSDAVVATAPVEGALHQTNTLDTLGLDGPEFTCKP